MAQLAPHKYVASAAQITQRQGLLGIFSSSHKLVMINDVKTFALSYFKNEDTKDEALIQGLEDIKSLSPSCATPACTLLLVSTHLPLSTTGMLVLYLQHNSFSFPGLEAFHQSLSPQKSWIHIKTALFPW